MKKLISIFLILCIMATLLPTVAFASEGEEETVAPIVAEFLKKEGETGTYDIGLINGKGFTLDAENSTTYKMQNYNDNVQLQVYYSASNSTLYSWPTKNHQNLKFTIKIEAEEAGYYSTDFDFTAHNNSAGYMMYVNGVAAGEIDGYIKGANATEDRSVKLNTVYLREGENTVSFRLTKTYMRTNADGSESTKKNNGFLFYPKKLTFTPCEESFVPVKFSTTGFPKKVVAGQPEEFTVSANVDESLTKFRGIYDDNGDPIPDAQRNLTVTSNDGDIAITEQSEKVVKGTFTAADGGSAKITATANVNGMQYTETITTTAVAPIVAEFLKKEGATGTYDIGLINGKGFTLDADNSTTYKMRNYNDNVQLQVYYSASNSTLYSWPTTNHQNLKFTIKIEAAEAGYYSTDFDFTAHNYSAGYMMYVNGLAAGEIDGYIWGYNASEERSVKLNTVYLNKGENTVSFRLTKTYMRTEADGSESTKKNNGFLFYPKKLTLTPCDKEFEVSGYEKISVSVSTDADFAGNLVVNGMKPSGAYGVYEFDRGDRITVKAEDIPDKVFRGWRRGGENGAVVSVDNEYIFTAATNVPLYAEYTDAPAANVTEYYDWNGEFLGYEEPATLSKYGFSFNEWKSGVFNGITRKVADYTAAGSYKITNLSNATTEQDLDSVTHETEITLKSEAPVSWYVNERLVACADTYTFLATQAARVLTDDFVTVGPIVNLTNPDGNTYILEYNANRKPVIEKGIIFGNGTPTVTSCSYKVISQRNADFGKLMAENDDNCSTVRGYIIYKDGDIHRVVYADIAE